MKAIVTLSGGLDSATCLALAVREYTAPEVMALSFKYDSKHNDLERASAASLAAHYGCALHVVDLTGLFAGMQSALLKGEAPLPTGHYEDVSMRQTVIPGRNIVFGAIAAAHAMELKASALFLGVHAGDHFIYPDCRPRFIEAFAAAVLAGTAWEPNGQGVLLKTPFLRSTKAVIVRLGLSLDVPYRLTRTCYGDAPVACGSCGSCQERLAAFAMNDVVDPIAYHTRVLLLKGA